LQSGLNLIQSRFPRAARRGRRCLFRALEASLFNCLDLVTHNGEPGDVAPNLVAAGSGGRAPQHLANRIVIAGFSQGASAAFATGGSRAHQQVVVVFVTHSERCLIWIKVALAAPR
jgi:hypothetical protein